MNYESIVATARRRGFVVEDEVIRSGTTSSLSLEMPSLERDLPACWWVERRRFVKSADGRRPLGIQVDVFSLEQCPDAETLFTRYGSATETLLEGARSKLGSAPTAVRAVGADRDAPGVLGVAPGSPLLAVEKLHRSIEHSLIHLAEARLRTDHLPLVLNSEHFLAGN